MVGLVDVFLGFDPGGRKDKKTKEPRFGWSICKDGPGKPQLLCSGTAGYAQEVFQRVLDNLPKDACVRASGIDAPMFWAYTWDRKADLAIRQKLRCKGDQKTSVQHINSLAGACLAQGVLLAELLHQEFGAPITEAHPKALLTLLGTSRANMGKLVQGAQGIQGPDKEDREDAVLAAYAAWSMHEQLPDWKDLLEKEDPKPFFPFQKDSSAMDIRYWMPIP